MPAALTDDRLMPVLKPILPSLLPGLVPSLLLGSLLALALAAAASASAPATASVTATATATAHAAPDRLQVRVHASGPYDLSERYVRELIALALEKGSPPGTDLQIDTTEPMTKTRAITTLKDGQRPGFVLNIAGQVDDARLQRIPVPTFLGASDYRICFGRVALKEEASRIRSLRDLQGYTFAHGQGWADTPVLRANALRVIEVQRIDSIFRMMSLGRVDLFCRNLLEVLPELSMAPPDVAVLDGFLLKYAAPHYLYVHQQDRALAGVLQAGLTSALKDGSAQALLMRHLKPSQQRFNLKSRRAIALEGGGDYPRDGLPRLEFLP